MIAAKSEKKGKKCAQSHPLYDPDLVRTSVSSRLTDFAFLNDPPTDTVSVLVPPAQQKI